IPATARAGSARERRSRPRRASARMAPGEPGSGASALTAFALRSAGTGCLLQRASQLAARVGAGQNRCTSVSAVRRMSAQYANFRECYPFSLSEPADRNCRRLHFVGSSLVLVVLAVAIATQRWLLLLLLPLLGYGFAWIGHFFFEHNRPATFTHPFYSFAGD